MKLERILIVSMILVFLAVSQTVLAQAFTVQGRVVDESGEPMIGVAVNYTRCTKINAKRHCLATIIHSS